MDFDSIENLYEYLDRECMPEIKKEITRKTLYIFFRRMKTDVYGAFKPKVYKRRGFSNGGFGDPTNIRTLNTRDGLIIEDVAKANGDDKGEDLAYYIENGIYGWKRKPPKRPIFEDTMNEVMVTGVVRKSIEEVLGRMDIEVK